MNCACGQARLEGAKFCPECGVAFAPRCASCGADLTPAAKFCAECGVATKVVGGAGKEISSQPSPEPRPPTTGSARKVVTVLFADLAGSTALHEGLDPESVNAFMERYYLAMRGAAEAHGGTVVKFLGDGVMVAFGVPRVAEDDAMRAVRAGVAMQRAFEDLARHASAAIGLRIAINTGEVIVNPDNTDVLGDPVNVAARLQQEARNGDVVLGESTQRLVSALVTLAPLGSVTLKGRAEAVKAYRVESLERPAGVIAAPFVGRAAELARLEAAYALAVEKPATGLAVLLGSPGLGKSRLIDELKRRLGDTTTVVTAYCDAAGGATFAPIAAALRAWLSDRADQSDPTDPSDQQSAIAAALTADAPDRARIVAGIAALLAGSPASPEETFFVVRRMLAALAQAKPVVLVIDDLHWAEPLLLDLVEHLVQWGSGVPLLVLVGARPELRDVRSSLVTPGGLVGDVITLAGLDAGAAMRLAANVIGAEDLPAAVAAKVLATSEGNPLFVGELVRMLVQEGALTKEGDRWVPGVALAALEMPPTIHALLAARIERLRPEERSVLERAAVVGRHFSRSAVAELMSRDVVDLDARLEALRRSELIEPDSGWFLGEPVLRFHHVLIRDAAYRRLLKGTRAELHGRFADWVAARAGDADHDETIGWHLEQAHQLLRELGPLDTVGRALGERAAQHLAAAGRRALARDDLPVAADLLGRAIDRLDTDDTARADLALDWCEALLSAGDVATAAKAIDELARFAGSGFGVQGSGFTGGVSQSENEPRTPNPEPREARLRAWHTCFAAQLTVLTAPQGLQTAADAVAAAAQQLAALGDAGGEAKAHSVHATALGRLGKVGACEAALDQALAAARRGGDQRRANAVLAGAPLAALWGPSPVTRASGRCLDVVRVLRITQGAPAVESVALSCQGVLEALRGRTEAARRMLASSRKMVEDLGIANRLFEADVFAGRVASMEGDTATAERLLRAAYDGLRDLGLGIDAARAGALLGRVLLAQNRSAEAEVLSHESEALAGDDLQAAIAWRGVRAEALVKRGEHTAAIELAKAAVAIASATDALLDHADARVALATALRAAGQGAEADAEERRAIELWEAKGATLLVERARTKSRPVKPTNVKPMPQPGSVHAESARSGRRVRPNTATAMLARLVAAVAARDFDGITRETPEDFESIDHPSGSSCGRGAVVASLRRLFRSRDPHYDVEPLATLGELLVLGRRRTRASGTESSRYDVGPYENEAFELFEANAAGKSTRTEVFAADHLGDAITRLYQRYADLLPAGPERERAAATARTFGVMLMSPDDVVRVATVIAPDFESVDHRPLRTWSMHSGPAFLEHLRALLEVAADVVIPARDILALEPNLLLTQRLHSGTERVGGGAYERPFLVLFATDADGRLARAEWFDDDREAEALARFEELSETSEHLASPLLSKEGARGRLLTRYFETSPDPSLVRRGTPTEPFANAASRTDSELFGCFNRRDWEGVLACVAPVMVFDERRRLVRNTCGRDVWLEQFRFLFDVPKSRFTWRLRATRGERLALNFHRFEGEVAEGGGPLAMEDHLVLAEVDGDGRIVGFVLFDLEDEDAAYAELDARFDTGEGAAHARVLEAMRAMRRASTTRDWDTYTALHDADTILRDHRVLGLGTIVSDREAWVRSQQTLVELAPDIHYRIDHLRLAARGFLWQLTRLGTRDGGAFENTFLAANEVDPQGRLRSFDTYDPEQLDLALARFAELGGANRQPPISSSRQPITVPSLDMAAKDGAYSGQSGRSRPRIEGFANAATRAVDRGTAALAARDWEGFAELFAAGARHFDRTRIAQLESDIREWLVSFRQIVEMTTAPPTQTLLATRGERLALFRMLWQGAEGDIGPSEIDWLLIVEVNVRGEHAAIVVYDPEDLDAAYAELDARWQEGEASVYPRASSWQRDLAATQHQPDPAVMVTLFAAEFVAHDHRLVGWGTLHGAGAFLETLRMLNELAPDVSFRPDHMRTTNRSSFSAGAWLGTREGGAFESPLMTVVELDAHGKALRLDLYDPHHSERAWARFDELRPDAPQRFANAATATVAPVIAHMVAHDWRGFEQLFAASFRMSDRRRLVQLDLDRDQYFAFTREIADGRAIRAQSEIVATRGERLALTRSTFEFTDRDVGPSEVGFLLLTQVDARGQIVAYGRWDLEDLGAARAELDARWAAHGAAEHPRASKWLAGYLHAFAVRDWTAMEALFTPDLVGENHRLVGWGTRHGPAGVVSTLQAQIDLAPDTLERVDHVRTCDGAVLFEYAWHGTREGGAFENVWLVLVELAGDGRAVRADVWEPDQLDQAHARFAELALRSPRSGRIEGIAARDASAASALTRSEERRPDPLRIPPNAATRTWDRWYETGAAGDWEAHRATHQPSYRFEDRRRLVRTVADLDATLVNDQHVFREGWRPSKTLLATAGDRLALRHILWTTGEAGAASEVEMLSLDEVDAEGRFVWTALFDPADRAAAEAELFERYVAGGGDGMPRGMTEYFRGVNTGDLARARTGLCDDFVLEDRRRTGMGRLEGGDAYIASVAVAHELTGELHVRPLYTAAIAPHGRVVMIRAAGTNTEGGAFESYCAALVLYRDECIASFEFFEPEELDVALARLGKCGA